MKPKVGIAVVAYKPTPELYRALSSAISQTYPNCKILFSDNSIDGLDRKVLEYIMSSGKHYYEYFRHERTLNVWEHYRFCYDYYKDVDYQVCIAQDDHIGCRGVDLLLDKMVKESTGWGFGIRSSEDSEQVSIRDYLREISGIGQYHPDTSINRMVSYSRKTTWNVGFHSLMKKNPDNPVLDWYEFVLSKPFFNTFDDQLLTMLLLDWSNFTCAECFFYYYDNGNWSTRYKAEKSSRDWFQANNVGDLEKIKLEPSQIPLYFLMHHFLDLLLIIKKNPSIEGIRFFQSRFAMLIHKFRNLLGGSGMNLKGALDKKSVEAYLVYIINLMPGHPLEIKTREFYFQYFSEILDIDVSINKINYARLSRPFKRLPSVSSETKTFLKSLHKELK